MAEEESVVMGLEPSDGVCETQVLKQKFTLAVKGCADGTVAIRDRLNNVKQLRELLSTKHRNFEKRVELAIEANVIIVLGDVLDECIANIECNDGKTDKCGNEMVLWGMISCIKNMTRTKCVKDRCKIASNEKILSQIIKIMTLLPMPATLVIESKKEKQDFVAYMEIMDNCVWTLGNIAKISYEHRNIIFNKDGLTNILKLKELCFKLLDSLIDSKKAANYESAWYYCSNQLKVAKESKDSILYDLFNSLMELMRSIAWTLRRCTYHNNVDCNREIDEDGGYERHAIDNINNSKLMLQCFASLFTNINDVEIILDVFQALLECLTPVQLLCDMVNNLATLLKNDNERGIFKLSIIAMNDGNLFENEMQHEAALILSRILPKFELSEILIYGNLDGIIKSLQCVGTIDMNWDLINSLYCQLIILLSIIKHSHWNEKLVNLHMHGNKLLPLLINLINQGLYEDLQCNDNRYQTKYYSINKSLSQESKEPIILEQTQFELLVAGYIRMNMDSIGKINVSSYDIGSIVLRYFETEHEKYKSLKIQAAECIAQYVTQLDSNCPNIDECINIMKAFDKIVCAFVNGYEKGCNCYYCNSVQFNGNFESITIISAIRRLNFIRRTSCEFLPLQRRYRLDSTLEPQARLFASQTKYIWQSLKSKIELMGNDDDISWADSLVQTINKFYHSHT